MAQPDSVDLRSSLGPVRWQGYRPTCLAFAASAVHEHARGSTDPLSPEALFRACEQRDPLATALGTTLLVAMEAIEEDGQCDETAWPYGHADASDPLAVYHRAQDDDHEEDGLVVFIRNNLAAGRAVLVTLELTDPWHSVGSDGLIADTGMDPQLGGHAVVAVGYDAVEELILIRNSWGVRWGMDGHGWLSDAYLDRYGYDAVVLASLPDGTS